MAALIFGVVVATMAGLAALAYGYGPIGALVIYSVAGQVAMVLFAWVALLRNRTAGQHDCEHHAGHS